MPQDRAAGSALYNQSLIRGIKQRSYLITALSTGRFPSHGHTFAPSRCPPTHCVRPSNHFFTLTDQVIWLTTCSIWLSSACHPSCTPRLRSTSTSSESFDQISSRCSHIGAPEMTIQKEYCWTPMKMPLDTLSHVLMGMLTQTNQSLNPSFSQPSRSTCTAIHLLETTQSGNVSLQCAGSPGQSTSSSA